MAALAQTATAPTPLIQILDGELQRNFRALQRAKPSPHFLAYAVTEQETDTVAASLGALRARNRNRTRYLDVTLRLGTPKLDSYRVVRGARPQFTAGVALSLDDNGPAIRRQLWAETDRIYRAGAQRLTNIQSNLQVNVADEEPSDDFSPAEPAREVRPQPKLAFDVEAWAAKARRWSGSFAKNPRILASGVSVSFLRETKTLVSSEGTQLQHGRDFARIVISAQAKSADGMDLGTSESFEAEEPGRLPNDAVVQAAITKVAADLEALLKAPTTDPYIGPAILSGRASGVFFHEIFGHRIEGHRQKDPTEGQTFTKSVNAPVLPDFLSVVFDPTKRNLGGVDLNGYYLYDDEGVQGRPVTLVDKGVLRTFLLSRTPIPNFAQSNGHGRRQPGLEVVSRQSNLIVESARAMPEAKLREALLAEVKRQNKPYGLYFQQVTGGYTTTGRRGVQAFKVMPVIVYRVYVDGRPDELIRGADIVGTPLASFGKIVATGEQVQVFNGYCGAESGSVPVSAVSPAILVSELEVQRQERAFDRPPLLPTPLTTGGGE